MSCYLFLSPRPTFCYKEGKTSFKSYWRHHIQSSPLFNKGNWKRWKKEICFVLGDSVSLVCVWCVGSFSVPAVSLAECEMIQGGERECVCVRVCVWVPFNVQPLKDTALSFLYWNILCLFSFWSSFKSLCWWRCQPLIWRHGRREGKVCFLSASVCYISSALELVFFSS